MLSAAPFFGRNPFSGQATKQQASPAFTEVSGVETTVHTWPAKVLRVAVREDLHDPIHIVVFGSHGFPDWGRSSGIYLGPNLRIPI